MSNNKLFSLATVFGITAFSAMAFAEGGYEAAASNGLGLKYLAAGFGMAIAVLGGTLGQSRALTTALDGITRNPGSAKAVFVPMLLGLALIESLVLVGFAVMARLAGLF